MTRTRKKPADVPLVQRSDIQSIRFFNDDDLLQ